MKSYMKRPSEASMDGRETSKRKMSQDEEKQKMENQIPSHRRSSISDVLMEGRKQSFPNLELAPPPTFSSVEISTDEGIFSGGGEMQSWFEKTDWASTPIGPLSEWPQALKTAVSICLTSRFGMVIWWGKEFSMLYNDKFRDILGPSRHPQFLGRPGREGWYDIWPIIGPMMESVVSTGKATWITDHLLPIEQHGQLTERYFTYSYSPIRTGSEIGGVFTATQETTSRVINERQVNTLKDLAARSVEALNVEEACKIIIDGLALNATDFSFAALYLIDATTGKCKLVEVTGIPRDSEICIEEVDLSSTDDNEMQKAIRSVATKGEMYVMDDLNQFHLPACGSWATEPTKCAVLPIASPGQDKPTGILVVGLNQLRRLDETYQTFLGLVTNQVGTTLANARAHETERNRAETLAALDKAKTIFFSNISHEFRTPLTLMLAPLEDLISRNSMKTSEKEQLTLVHRNSLRLLKLVNTLLDFSRIESGRIQALYQPTDLTALTIDLASVFRSACEKENLELIIDCEPIDEPVYIDHDMWEKIVLNLLSNSFKYTFSGSITVKLRHDYKNAYFSVIDTGTGIPKDEIPHIFERFHRVIGAEGRSFEGTGIGLALVSELVKLHDGTIQCESDLGKGTAMTVTIPLGHVHLPSAHIKQTQQSTSSVQQRSYFPLATKPQKVDSKSYSKNSSWWLPTLTTISTAASDISDDDYARSTTGKRFRILLADDNADMREYVSKLLQRHYDVEVTADGEIALAAAYASPPDLVLSDVMMPNLDGFGLLKALRSDPRTNTIPVIFLSARAGEEARVEGLQSGVDDYVIKPFTARELLARVKSHLEMSQVRSYAIKQAQKANEAKDHFLAVLSHELRTPLTPALILAEAMETNTELSSKVREDAAIISRNIRLEVQLIDDLLDLTKITKGKLVLNCKVVSLHDLLHYTTQIVKTDILEKGLQVTFDLRATREHVYGDSSRIQQIFWNVLKNGVKFTPGGGKITLHTYNTDDGKNIRVDIVDTGIGISSETLPKIFNSFEQGGPSITHQFGGLGLGLSISKALATMHSGQLYASSEGIGKGATFTAIFPVVDPPKDSGEIKEATPKSDLHVNILLVEDNKPTLLVITRFLKKLGHNVITACTLQEGIAMANGSNVPLDLLISGLSSSDLDLILADIGLPDGSGLDLLQYIHPTVRKNLKSIALSGYGMDEDVKKSLNAGFAMHLIKPVQISTLENAINSLFGSCPGRRDSMQ